MSALVQQFPRHRIILTGWGSEHPPELVARRILNGWVLEVYGDEKYVATPEEVIEIITKVAGEIVIRHEDDDEVEES